MKKSVNDSLPLTNSIQMLKSEQRGRWRESGSCKICFSRLLQSVDQPHEFLCGMRQGNIIVLTFSTFFGKVFGKDRIPMTNVLGCVVKGISQIA